MSLSKTQNPNTQTILGLDIGANSIGWALLSAHYGKPQGLLGTGVRIFPEGVDGGLEGLRSGRDVSKG
ncbi:MAG TPA: hypothetical protein VMV05_05490, partial [bacterium]|nr:hypothetical protein [bacterium]